MSKVTDSVAYLGEGACGHTPLGTSENRYTVKNGISNLYILLNSALKTKEMPFQRPNFKKFPWGPYHRTPLELCRHYGLPLTKILATPLVTVIVIQHKT